MENVTKGRKLVVIQNPDIAGGHEWEIVTKMEKGNHLIWCKNIDELEASIEIASKKEFKPFRPTQLNLSKVIREITSKK